MKEWLTIALIGLGLACPGTVRAQWEGEAGLGIVRATGNTTSESLSGTATLSRESVPWRHHLTADFYRARTDDVDTADRLSLGYKIDRDFGERRYGWVSLRWDEDLFANLDSRYVLGVGIGHKVLVGPVHTLDLEAGFGANRIDYIDATPIERGAVGIVAANYRRRLNDQLTFTQRVSAEGNRDNVLLVSNTSLKVKMTSTLSLALSHLIKHNTDIVGAAGTKTDVLTTINIVYSF